MFTLTRDQIDSFRNDGFVFGENFVDDATIDATRESYEQMFRGNFETGVFPDEVNWQEGKSDPSLTRQICCGWKGNLTVARTVLREDIGRACAQLAGWPGARVFVDNVLWKPAGTRSLGMHQDAAYLPWMNPQEILSCWIALDDTAADGGTMEVVSGSHKWAVSPPEGEFHGPEDYQEFMRKAADAEGIEDPEIVPIVVKRGSGSFHHGLTWHGSGPNRSGNPRRSLVVHCISSETEYVPEHINVGIGPVYGRYMRRDGVRLMDENHFPILWTEDGRRSAWIDDYLKAAL
ncbi:MAG: phytanoyl-CoA dioxygenase family protein [Rhodospirillales bacterium]|nr:phytanoyl-CoA dioxygenase family protein [Rhodospirillales bacterium]